MFDFTAFLQTAAGAFFGALAAFGFNWLLHLIARREERRAAFGAATQMLAMQYNDFHNFSLAMAGLQKLREASSPEAPPWLLTQAIAVPFNETLHQNWNALGFVFSSTQGAEVIDEFTRCELLHFDLANLLRKHEALALEIQAILAQINPELERDFSLAAIQAGIGPARWLQLKSVGKALIERWENNQGCFEKALGVAKTFAKRELGLKLSPTTPSISKDPSTTPAAPEPKPPLPSS